MILTSPKDHQSVFKYVGLNTKTSWEYLERTLNEFELVGSTSAALNDPFELSPLIFDDLRPDTVAQSVGYTGLSNRLSGIPDDVHTVFRDVNPYREKSKEYLDRITRNSRIISFCARSDSPLLWSHYAQSHKGACLHFLGKAFNPVSGDTGYVEYSDHRPTYPLSLALRLDNIKRNTDSYFEFLENSNHLLCFVKAKEWEYESEIRSVYNAKLRNCLKFNPLGLVSIIVGSRMKSEDIFRIERLIAMSPLKTLPVRRARISENSFSVEIEPLLNRGI